MIATLATNKNSKGKHWVGSSLLALLMKENIPKNDSLFFLQFVFDL
jgi:hypothetical protein